MAGNNECEREGRCSPWVRRGAVLGVLLLVVGVAVALVVSAHPQRSRIGQMAAPAAPGLVDTWEAQQGAIPQECRPDEPGEAVPGAAPAAVAWEETLQFPTGLEEPRGVAVGPDGRFYVVGDRVLRIYSPQGEAQLEVPLVGPPTAVTVTPEGQIYLTLRDRVMVYDTWGQPVSAWNPAGERAFLTSVAVVGKETWVGDAGNRVVLRYDEAAQIVGRLGEGELVLPSPYLDVVPLPNGMILVNNPGKRWVVTYDPQGPLKWGWGQSGANTEQFPGCCNPVHLALLPDGKIVTSQKGLPLVKVYEQRGTLESVVAGPRELGTNARGLDLAVDGQGRIVVLEAHGSVVRVFQRVGTGT